VPRRLSIATKFFLTYFVITGTALAFAGLAGYCQFRAYVMEEADQTLVNQARLAAEMFRPMLAAPAPDREEIAREGDRLGRTLDTRLTVILPGGEVVADSRAGAAALSGMENHADRPEVRDALSGGTGISARRGISLGEDQRYAAVPIHADGRIVGVARTSVPVSSLNRRLRRIRTITWGTGLAAFFLMLAGTAIRAKRVTGPLEEIRTAAREFASGARGKRLRIRTGDELEEVAAALNESAVRLEQTIRQLDAEKAHLETLLDNLSEGVIVVARDRTLRMMSRRAAGLLGIAAEPREGSPYAETIRHPGVLRILDDCRSGASLPPAEVAVPHPDGEKILFVSATTVRHAWQARPDLLLTLRDITEERRLSRIKSDFVSNASHELRTPLTNIRGYLEALQDTMREGAPIDPEFLSIAHANALRMERLIDDLLELSRAESAKAPLEMEEILLPVFLERVASLHRRAAEGRGGTLSVRAGDAVLRADPRKLLLAVSNLVDNAVKYGREGGTVTLEGMAEEGAVVIEVADDGPGIPPRHLARIFERFYRVDTGRSRELGGTGLGLSIAKHIVEAHGGSIRAESRLGVGSRFRIRIPA
jgi:two-component system, OmpR family, phosphate regulon sensor histidine kinase PhoR